MNKFPRAASVAISLLVLIMAAGPAQAEEYGVADISTAPPGAVGEAAKAVVDRVFGVKGEAADIRYHAVELSNYSPFNAGIRSALLPGWGQRFNRQPIKGAVLFSAVALGAYGTVRAYDRSKDKYNEYKAIGNRNHPAYDDYDSSRTTALALGSATIALWAYSVYDAYRNAYNPLFGRDPSVQVALLEDGASVEWRRRFGP